MEQFHYPLEERVFHIDHECYIIYLGSDRRDERPFLRIGNSPRLTRKIVENIYNIIVTDSITGDPTLEPLNITAEEIRKSRYVGDTKTIGNFIDLLHRLDVKNGNVGTFEEIKAAHDRAEAFFYDDGNIRLFYDQKILFDLSKREKKDLHSVERSSWLKGLLGKNPLRYRPDDFQRPGFFLMRGCPALFDKGRLLCFGLTDDYPLTFAMAGIDPDMIDTLITDEPGGYLFTLLKRKGTRGEPIRVLGENSPLCRSAVTLLKSSRLKDLAAEIEGFKQGTRKTALDFRIEKLTSGYLIEHKLLPWPLVFSSDSGKFKNSLVVNTARKMIFPPVEAHRNSLNCPEGILHRFLGDEPHGNELLQAYLRDVIFSTSVLMSEDESLLAGFLQKLLEAVSGGEKSTPFLERVKLQIKRVTPNPKRAIAYLLSNAGEICSLFLKQGMGDVEGVMVLADARKAVQKWLGSAGRIDIHLPLIADAFSGKGRFSILYRPLKRSLTKSDCDLSMDTLHSVEEYERKKEQFFEQELRRLTALIEELSAPPSKKAMVVPAEAMAGAEAALPETGKKAVIAPGGRVAARKGEITISGMRRLFAARRKGKEQKRAAVQEEKEYEGARVYPPARRKVAGARLWIILPVAAVVLAASLLSLYLILPGTRARKEAEVGAPVEAEVRAPVEAGGPEKGKEAVSAEEVSGEPPQEAVETVAGKSAAEWEEFLAEKGIPHSTLTGQRTVLYRGTIEITVLDILILTNRIAVSNGYRTLQSRMAGKDPDWIYPGNLFMLPDGTRYTVVGGDTMWYIAHRFIIQSLETVWDRYTAIGESIESGQLSADERNRLASELEMIKGECYSENFRREIDKKLEKLKASEG